MFVSQAIKLLIQSRVNERGCAGVRYILVIGGLPRAVRQQCRAIRSPAVLWDALAKVAHLSSFSPLQRQQIQLHRTAALAQKCEKLSIRRPAWGYVMMVSQLCTRQLSRCVGFPCFTLYPPGGPAWCICFGV